MPQHPRAGLRLMHVHAHPDDESSKGAASTARYVAEGVDVHVATCTGGERGSILNPKMDRPDILENITEIRRQEMERARDILGVRRTGSFVDSGWPEGDPKPPLPEGCFALVPLEEAAAPLVRLIREFRPHVVTTYDERGGYPHPDHVKCHEVTVAAFEAAGDPERYPDLGEPWQPLKLYYHHSFNRPRMEALHNAMLEHGLESPWASASRSGSRSPSGTRGSPRGCRAASTSASATRRCWRTPPRSTRTGTGSRSRASCRRRSGPPRSTSWS